MVKKLVGKLTEQPAADGMRTNGHAAPKVAVTKIKTAAIVAPTKAATKPKANPPPQPEPAATKPAPVTKPAAAEKKRGLFDGLKEAVYG